MKLADFLPNINTKDEVIINVIKQNGNKLNIAKTVSNAPIISPIFLIITRMLSTKVWFEDRVNLAIVICVKMFSPKRKKHSKITIKAKRVTLTP